MAATETPINALRPSAGLPADELAHLTLTGTEPALLSSFAFGTAAQASFAAAALAAAGISRRRNALRQQARADMRHARLECCSHFLIDGLAPNFWDKLAGGLAAPAA